MHTLESLRKTIDTATDLRSVVTTMKTLAAVSIRQYERAVEALEDYSHAIELGFQIALRNQSLATERPAAATQHGAVVLGSDQGMCGRFNDEIVSFVQRRLEDNQPGQRWKVLVVGSRAEGQLLDAGREIDQTYRVPTSVSEITSLVEDLLPRVERWRGEADGSQLLVFYNRRGSASSYEPQEHLVFPIKPERLRRWSAQRWQSHSLPTFTMDRQQLLSRVVRHHIFVSLFRACAESLASENASRIAAMQAAEKNIEERLDELHGQFNHLRQTAINEELLDVVTGFEALKLHARDAIPDAATRRKRK